MRTMLMSAALSPGRFLQCGSGLFIDSHLVLSLEWRPVGLNIKNDDLVGATTEASISQDDEPAQAIGAECRHFSQ